jgi:hypothetical protein
MNELVLIKGVYDADCRMVAVDFHITDTNLQYKVDLQQLVKRAGSVAQERNGLRDENMSVEEKYIAPTFDLFKPAVWERPH